MFYERYDLVRAFEGDVPQQVLHAMLPNCRNIVLVPPIEKRIVLVAKAGYSIGVVHGNKEEEQPFLGAYKYSGVIDDGEVEALRADPGVTVEFSGQFKIIPAPADAQAKFVQTVRGTGKDYVFTGAILLLEAGEQHGDFEFAWHRSNIGIENVSGDLDAPVYRVGGQTPEEAEFWLGEMLKRHPSATVDDNPSEDVELELILRLSDNELRAMIGPEHQLESFRKHVRRQLTRLRLGKVISN